MLYVVGALVCVEPGPLPGRAPHQEVHHPQPQHPRADQRERHPRHLAQSYRGPGQSRGAHTE